MADRYLVPVLLFKLISVRECGKITFLRINDNNTVHRIGLVFQPFHQFYEVLSRLVGRDDNIHGRILHICPSLNVTNILPPIYGNSFFKFCQKGTANRQSLIFYLILTLSDNPFCYRPIYGTVSSCIF